MRLPFPERFPLFLVLGFCTVIFVLQQLDGTTLFFSICTFFFILIAAMAFNTAGGLTRPSGAYIFSYAIFVPLIGMIVKIVLGEPAQGNLLQPERTIEVYVGTVCAMLAAAAMTRKFTPKKNLFPNFSSDTDMGRAAIGCVFLGAAAQIYATFGPPATPGSLLAILYQLNVFLPLAMILGVTSAIRRSGGRRSINASVVIAGFFLFASGILSYSKTGMFAPFACWLFPAAAQRYKVNILQVAGLILSLFFVGYYLAPYSQVGRAYHIENGTFQENFKNNIFLLSNLNLVRKAQSQAEEAFFSREDLTFIQYYNKTHGLADRLQMIAPDDAIINATENGAVFGIFPTIFAFENVIPHFIWHNKPIIQFGNLYAHEIGILTDESDTTTGISFSPSGEAYHQAKWVGILVLLPALLFMLFLFTDTCCGDTRTSPFALLPVIAFLHGAPEGGSYEIVRASTIELLTIGIAAVVCCKFMPLLSNLMVGPAKQQMNVIPGLLPSDRLADSGTEVPEIRTAQAPLSPYRWSRPDSQV